MTIRDLLSHQSGLGYGEDNASAVDSAYKEQNGPHDFYGTLAEMSSALSKFPLKFSPGTAWHYSLATDLCGYLVEVISGLRFDEFLSKHIFEPLGMTDTAFSVPNEKLQRFAACYAPDSEAGMKLVDDAETSPFRKQPSFHSGGGGLMSTAMDYYKFLQMLLNGGVADDRRYLSRKTIELMTLNHLTDGASLQSHGFQGERSEPSQAGFGFGLGFQVTLDRADSQIVGSIGQYSWGGYASTEYWVDPTEDIVVVFMTQLTPSGFYPIKRELQVLVNAAIND